MIMRRDNAQNIVLLVRFLVNASSVPTANIEDELLRNKNTAVISRTLQSCLYQCLPNVLKLNYTSIERTGVKMLILNTAQKVIKGNVGSVIATSPLLITVQLT